MTDAVLPIGQEIAAWLPRIPALSAIPAERIFASRLGGLTNRNHRLTTPAGEFVLRIPGEGTGDYIDRKNEAAAARITAEIGVNAPLVFFDADSGVQLAGFIAGAKTMNAESFRDKGAVARAARSLRRVHRCGKSFPNRFELFRMIDDYLALLKAKNAQLPEGYASAQKEADAVRRVLATAAPAPVPCHCDPLAENFLDTGSAMFVIDWEYAGNNDPMWDLGDLSVEAGFDRDQDAALLAAYFDGAVPPAERARMILYKAMCDLLWTLWGVIQHVNGNPAEDFRAYAENRFRRCRDLMADPAFAQALAEAAIG